MSSPGLSAFDDMLSPQMESAYKALDEQNKLRAAALEKDYYAPQRAMWDKIRTELEGRRTGPSASERLYALGAALSQPTPYRGIAGTLSNVAPVLAEQQKAARAAEEAKRDLMLKYGMETGKLGLEQKKAEIEAGQALAEARYKALSDQYRIANTPRFVPGVGFVSSASITRPANVPANYVYGKDNQTGQVGYFSPDGKTFIPVDQGGR